MTKFEFLKSLPKREKIYMIYSRLTNLPYVECNADSFDDEVFLFAEEEDALETARSLSEEKQPAVVMKVEQKDMLKMFADLYVHGITCVVVSVGREVLRMALSEVVRRPDVSKNTEKALPLENPALQLSMMYYLQEARKSEETSNAEYILALEDEMAVNLLRAKYLLPIKEVEVDGKKRSQLLLMRTKGGEVMAPIFTDAVEYNRFVKDRGLKAAVTDFEKLAKMHLPEEAQGFLLNPAGAGLVLTEKYLQMEMELNQNQEEPEQEE